MSAQPGRRPPIMVIAPSKYVQGPGALEDLGRFLDPLGRRASVISSTTCWERVGSRVEAGARSGGVELDHHHFDGESSRAQVDAGAQSAADFQAEVVIGLGGGKAIDTAKSVANRLGLPCAVLPTIASTDAPTSALSVLYTETGEVDIYEFHTRNPDLVLVDSAVVAEAPARYLASGMADAVATRWEGRAAAAAGSVAITGGRPSNAALTLGEQAWHNCRHHGLQAFAAVQVNAVTESVEVVIETNTYHSGVGFESGGFSGAHSVHNGLTALERTHHMMHGEKVAFGLLCQLILEARPEAELDEYIDWASPLGLPVTLDGIGVGRLSDEELHLVSEVAVREPESIHWMPFPVTAEMVGAAVLGADAYARRRLASQGASVAAASNGASTPPALAGVG